MPITLTQVPQNNNTGENTDPVGAETTFDGQTFFFAPGQTRSFSNSVGEGHAASTPNGEAAGAIVEDNSASTKKYPNAKSRC